MIYIICITFGSNGKFILGTRISLKGESISTYVQYAAALMRLRQTSSSTNARQGTHILFGFDMILDVLEIENVVGSLFTIGIDILPPGSGMILS